MTAEGDAARQPQVLTVTATCLQRPYLDRLPSLGAESDWVVPDRAPKALVVYYTVMDPRGVDVSADSPAPQVDVQALAAEAAAFLEQVPVGEGIGAKLSRLLLGFFEAEVVPQATRAADQGIDPTPLLAVVGGVLRLFADALEHPDGAGH